MTPQNRAVSLVRHPDTPCAAVRAIDVVVGRNPDGLLLRYTVTGAIAALRIPAVAAPRRADRLWEHTCLEAFAGADDGSYREFNFSPSGAWAAYGFDRYRERSGWTCPVDLRADVERTDDRLELAIVLPASALPSGGSSTLALSAVIESADGSLSYWALRHPAGRPDFHHRDGFALPLDAVPAQSTETAS